MPKTYEYSFGSVRAREKYLFTNADIEAMLSFNSIKELKAFLRDKGYGEGETVDEIIRSNRLETFEYLKSIVPDISVFDVFLFPNDAHNIKSVIKGLLSGSEYKNLCLTPNTIDFSAIETAVKENNYSLLPEGFSDSAEKAYETLAHTTDARKADAYIDKACMKMQLEKAKQTKNEFLIDYVSTEIFYRNVKVALRACKTGADEEYCFDALFDGIDAFDVKKVVSVLKDGIEALKDYFSSVKAYSCPEAMEKFSSSPSEFEKFTENLLMKKAKKACKKSGSGPEAALGFYIARLGEEKAIHIISVGIETNADKLLTRERLREIYA